MNWDFQLDRIGAVLLVEVSGTGSIRLGRSLDNEVLLSAPTVSRHHACILFFDNQVWIHDLSSANGTFVNLTLIQSETRIDVWDEIALGPEIRIRVRLMAGSRAARNDP
jgi:pSer/pThr/pTyr-binding forkhead associated (FHA) protein